MWLAQWLRGRPAVTKEGQRSEDTLHLCYDGSAGTLAGSTDHDGTRQMFTEPVPVPGTVLSACVGRVSLHPHRDTQGGTVRKAILLMTTLGHRGVESRGHTGQERILPLDP